MKNKTNDALLFLIFPLYSIDKQIFITTFPNKLFLSAYFSNGGNLRPSITIFTTDIKRRHRNLSAPSFNCKFKMDIIRRQSSAS